MVNCYIQNFIIFYKNINIGTSNFIFMRRIDYHSDIYSIIFCRKNILPLRKFKNLKFGTYLQIYHINEELGIIKI